MLLQCLAKKPLKMSAVENSVCKDSQQQMRSETGEKIHDKKKWDSQSPRLEGFYKGHCLCVISNELSSFHSGQKCVYRDVWGGVQ